MFTSLEVILLSECEVLELKALEIRNSDRQVSDFQAFISIYSFSHSEVLQSHSTPFPL